MAPGADREGSRPTHAPTSSRSARCMFEMLTGRTAFEGKTRASLLGAILKDEPPRVSTVQPLAPAALDRIVATLPREGS